MELTAQSGTRDAAGTTKRTAAGVCLIDYTSADSSLSIFLREAHPWHTYTLGFVSLTRSFSFIQLRRTHSRTWFARQVLILFRLHSKMWYAVASVRGLFVATNRLLTHSLWLFLKHSFRHMARTHQYFAPGVGQIDTTTGIVCVSVFGPRDLGERSCWIFLVAFCEQRQLLHEIKYYLHVLDDKSNNVKFEIKASFKHAQVVIEINQKNAEAKIP